MAVGRLRRVPSGVYCASEWINASALARTIHRQLRPSGGELALPRATQEELPWRQFQRFSAEQGADYSPEECELIVGDCTRAGLWCVRDGALVIAAFPPSFERERQALARGPRGGKSGAEKMRELRAKRRAERDAAEDEGREGVTGASRHESGHATGGDAPSSSSSSGAPLGAQKEEGTPDPNGHTVKFPAEEPAAPPAPTPDPLERLAGAALGEEVWRRIRAAAPRKVGAAPTDAAELAGVGALVGAAGGRAEVVDGAGRWLAAASGERLRAVFPWTTAAKEGRAVVVTPGLLLGKAQRAGGWKASGWKALGEAIAADAATAAEVAARRAALVPATRPGPVQAGPELSREAFEALAGRTR